MVEGAGAGLQSGFWQRDPTAKVLENIEVAPPAHPYLRDRAPWPLCGDTPQMESRGFAFPIGLERHLEGFANQRQCPVMRAVGGYLTARHSEKYPER